MFCREKCSDCCYAIFDMPLIEALYLKSRFLEKFFGKEKNELLEIADKTDRALVKLKRDAYKKSAERGGSAGNCGPYVSGTGTLSPAGV